MSLLAELNHDERDLAIDFDEPTHIYTVYGDSSYTSVTGFVHGLFPVFQPRKVIDTFYSKWQKDPGGKYYGMSKLSIQEMWTKNGQDASRLGTLMHEAIEYHLNGENHEAQSTPEFFQYLRMTVDVIEKMKLRPFRTEKRVFVEALHLAGSVDALFITPEGKIQVWDWKRSKEIKMSAFRKSDVCLHPLLGHLPNCNFVTYSLQLHVYRLILHRWYSYDMDDKCFLGVCHPDRENYQVVECMDLRKEVIMLFEELLC